MKHPHSIYENVTLGKDVEIGAFVIIGEPPKGFLAGEMKTEIGPFAVIRSHTVIYAGNTVGERLQTGHGVLIRELNQIGDNVSIVSHSVIEHHVQIGHGVRIHSNVFIPECSILEEDARVGPSVVFTNALYPLGRDVKETLKGPQLSPSSKIGANATLRPGVVIDCNTLVGAGSAPMMTFAQSE